MKSLGGALFFFGVGSIVLHFLNMNFALLMWIGMWGEGIAWAIRAAMIVLGGAMWIMGKDAQ